MEAGEDEGTGREEEADVDEDVDVDVDVDVVVVEVDGVEGGILVVVLLVVVVVVVVVLDDEGEDDEGMMLEVEEVRGVVELVVAATFSSVIRAIGEEVDARLKTHKTKLKSKMGVQGPTYWYYSK